MTALAFSPDGRLLLYAVQEAGSDWRTLRVLDVGSGDTYSQARPGQSFEVTDLPNGVYYIQVKANPANKLSELSTANNSSLRRIVLGGSKAQRTLYVPAVNGIKG